MEIVIIIFATFVSLATSGIALWLLARNLGPWPFKDLETDLESNSEPDLGTCMGYDLQYDGYNNVKVIDCKVPLTESNIHRVIEDLDDSFMTAEGVTMSGGGTMVSRDTCKKHCLGGCGRGCPKQERNDNLIKVQSGAIYINGKIYDSN